MVNFIKYLFKYITTKDDEERITLKQNSKCIDNVNEETITKVVKEIFKSEKPNKTQPVQKLSIHLPNKQPCIFRDNDYLETIGTNMEYQHSMFTRWLEMNKNDQEARNLTYLQFPTKYVWNKSSRSWKRRKIGTSIGRIKNVHPASGELYYLRVLLNYKKGPTSYEDILTVDGITHNSFKDACVAMGLLEGNEEWHEAMKEASLWATANQLRNLFVMLLVHCEVTNPLKLWNSHWKDLSEDMPFDQRKLYNFGNFNLKAEEMKSYTLMEIKLLLENYNRSFVDNPEMPKLDNSLLTRLYNPMIKFACSKAKNKEKELIFEDFLDVRSVEEQQRIHQDNIHSNFPTTVNYDIPKLATTILEEEHTVKLSSESEDFSFS